MTESRVHVDGMKCEGCVGEVRRAISAVSGVEHVAVSLPDNEATFSAANPAEATPLVVAAIREAGFEARSAKFLGAADQLAQEKRPESLAPAESQDPSLRDSSAPSIRLEIEGMHCASCVSQVEAALQRVDQVAAAHVNLPLRQATVRLQPGAEAPDVGALLQAVERAGYVAAVTEKAASQVDSWEQRDANEQRDWLRRTIVAVVGLGYLLAAGPLQAAPSFGGWLPMLVALIVQGYSGAPFFRGAVARLRYGGANMDSLVALGSGAAFLAAVAGQLGLLTPMPFVESAMILSFLSLGRWLESRARGAASQAIFGLMRLASNSARVIRNGEVCDIPTTEVAVGETIIVEPGESAPLDGVVLQGQSHLDESWLTGESAPVPKEQGDEVFAGAVNQEGSLQVRVQRRVDDTVLAQVVQLVRDTQQTKTSVQRLADQVVAWFTPVVVLIALLTITVWSALGDGYFGLHCMIAVLVVACPCALGLATPTAILVASGRAARRGILIKNAESLEIGGLVDLVMLDKTGTITCGSPEVVSVVATGDLSENEIVSVAASLELLSKHPLALAIVREAERRGVEFKPADNLQIHEGEGVEGQLAGQAIFLGNEALMERVAAKSDRQYPDSGKQTTAAESSGSTVVWVSRGGERLGWLAIADAVAPHAAEAIGRMREQGVDVAMVTGDRQATAAAVAAQVGIEDIHAQLHPQDKLTLLNERRTSGRVVAMIGDGVNDSPALAAADLGVAMGAGADIALEAADVVLVKRGLDGAGELLRLARSTRRIIRQNLGWAFAYNIVLIPVAAGLFSAWGVYLHPAMAAAAMAMSSISVVLNALRVSGGASH